MQRVQKVVVQNFKGLDNVYVETKGNHVILVAKNGGGKTSFIDAVMCNVKVKQPLKEGARKGLVHVEIDDYVIEFNFTKSSQKPKLNVFDRSGKPQSAPQTLLDKLFGIKNFDIDDFLSKSPAKKVDFIKDIIGIDWSDIDNRYKELYEERTFLNRKIKEHDAKMMSIPPVKDSEAKDTDAISSRLREASEKNMTIERIEIGVSDKIAEIKKLKEKLSCLEKEVIDGKDWLSKNKKTDTSMIEGELKEAIDHNKSIALFEAYKKERLEGQENVNKVLKIEEEMQSIEETKKEQLSSIEMPVKGLTFEENQLYLDGLPFESNQINTARRLIAGLEIQYHLMGEVSIARIEGSLLDMKSAEEVLKWADSKGIQLFIEQVDRDGGELKIEVIEN